MVVVSAMAMVVVLPGYLRRLPRRCSTLGIDLFVRKDLAEILCCFKPTIDSRTCTIRASDMELILRGLDLQIRASGEGVQIEGCVPAQAEEEDNLVTIAQTSA